MKARDKKNNGIDRQRLTWACRRGMLELDIILQRYLAEKYDHASMEEQALFIKLLEEGDQDLFDWFFKKLPAPQEFRGLIRCCN